MAVATQRKWHSGIVVYGSAGVSVSRDLWETRVWHPACGAPEHRNTGTPEHRNTGHIAVQCARLRSFGVSVTGSGGSVRRAVLISDVVYGTRQPGTEERD
ncbi:hypothetical protein GCM10027416_25740 [Okibacterium endophyticum]